MTPFNYVLAYVDDAPRSADLYTRLLGTKPVESSPDFAMFVLPGGIRLGLWNRGDVAPAATPPGGMELCFPAIDDAAVTRTRNDWAAIGLDIVQEPTMMDFGFTFTAADPDGHRLRVFAPTS